MKTLRMTPLSSYNNQGLNNHQAGLRAGVSYPTAVKYLKNEVEEPQLFYVVKLLDGLGVDWQHVTLGDLVKVTE